LNAEFKGNLKGEYGWFAAGAASPAVSISADRAARSIVGATIRRQREKILSIPAEVLARLQGVAPVLARAALGVANRLLPASEGCHDDFTLGREIEAEFTSTVWKVMTKLGQNAAASLNQILHEETRTGLT
jgi:hypothetical protein